MDSKWTDVSFACATKERNRACRCDGHLTEVLGIGGAGVGAACLL